MFKTNISTLRLCTLLVKSILHHQLVGYIPQYVSGGEKMLEDITNIGSMMPCSHAMCLFMVHNWVNIWIMEYIVKQ